ncbi:hypothetical protein EC973_004629 [Apophysomyces ossiformis]|uniref:Protein kinase domain-containing protein n=1 Tax=Apophysomyces ossiformis TaxID=679940 RepID=A0A8H7BK13_9FUNG|nr:hypothetical protein EC973_004629 [Apophysomyces ossiformis]
MSTDQYDPPFVTLTAATDSDSTRQAISPKSILITGQPPPTPSPVLGHAAKRSLTGSDLFSGLRIVSNGHQDSDQDDQSGPLEGHVITSIDEFEFKGIIGSCLDIMKNNFPEGLDEPSIAVILKQALEGLAYLHKNGHIHRDVKAGNLLMDEDGTVLLADFGVSSSLMETGGRGLRKTFVGTPCWMAPEVMEQAGYDYKADIWSFGITAIELASGHAPYAKLPPLKVLMMTLSNDPPTLVRETTKHKYSRLLKEVVDMCLNKDPSKRPTSEKLLQHPFFRQTKKKEYLIKTLLAEIAPLEQRSHKRIFQKEVYNAKTDEWDFNDQDEEERQSSGTTELNPPKRHISFGDVVIRSPQLHSESNISLPSTNIVQPTEALANTPSRKSRFVIEDIARDGLEFTKPPPSPGRPSPSELSDSRLNNNEYLETGMKIGRFSINQLSRQPSASERPPTAASSSDSKQMSRAVSHDNTRPVSARDKTSHSRGHGIQHHSMDQDSLKGIMRVDEYRKVGNPTLLAHHSTADKPEGASHSPDSSSSSLSSTYHSNSYIQGHVYRATCDPATVATCQSHIQEMLKNNEAQRLLLQDMFQTLSVKSKELASGEVSSENNNPSSSSLQSMNRVDFHANPLQMSECTGIESLQRQLEALARERDMLKSENQSLRCEIEHLKSKQTHNQAHA